MDHAEDAPNQAPDDIALEKPKKARSAAQLEAFARARATMLARREQAKAASEQRVEEIKNELKADTKPKPKQGKRVVVDVKPEPEPEPESEPEEAPPLPTQRVDTKPRST